ncbi:alanine racemase [Microbacterium lacus]|uniref:alanine racemase n=1 Tax=Microbacterium lacus TaxID=415217 RepID=UPI00384D5911
MTRLMVDLERIRSNIAVLQRHIAPAEFMLVVKDDAYGHGVEAVIAAAEGVRWFGSFDVATGVRVRAVTGPEARIFTWSAVSEDELVQARDARLDLGVGDFATLARVAEGSGAAPVRVHLKIDTGLHRSGVRPEEWADFVARAAAAEASGTIVVAGIWSHIAEASDADDDRARAEFDRAVDVALAAGLKPEMRHLAASAAAHARPEFRYDLVRFGAFAYGVRSAEGANVPGIEPAATLLASVTAVDDDTVEIGIGALDGLPSTLSGRVPVRTVAGARALRVGLASSIVAGWDGAAIGDEVAIFGPGGDSDSSATTLAEAIDSVGEEILVRLSPLLPREYVG